MNYVTIYGGDWNADAFQVFSPEMSPVKTGKVTPFAEVTLGL